MKKKKFDFEKCMIFWVKIVNGSFINVMRLCEKLISCVKLDHTFYLKKYGINSWAVNLSDNSLAS